MEQNIPKTEQARNGNIKISDYLTLVDNDDFVISERIIQTVVNKENILKENNNCTDLAILKKRKISEIDADGNPPQKKNNIIERELSPDSSPSISESENRNVTLLNNENKQVIFIKCPEKLLTPAALKEFRSPENQAERFLDKIRTPMPEKLPFDNNKSPPSLVSTVHEMSVARSVVNDQNSQVTPKKLEPDKKSEISPEKSPKDKRVVTPNKIKKSTKLYNTSPVNSNEFNVQVTDKFIKLTSSKISINEDNDVIFIRSTEKKQSSILNYFSPSAFKRYSVAKEICKHELQQKTRT